MTDTPRSRLLRRARMTTAGIVVTAVAGTAALTAAASHATAQGDSGGRSGVDGVPGDTGSSGSTGCRGAAASASCPRRRTVSRRAGRTRHERADLARLVMHGACLVGQAMPVPDAVADGAAEIVATLMADVDRAVSRFRADSELEVVNDASPRLLPVGPLTLTLVEAAIEAARRTDGAVDPTVGCHVAAWGYDADIDVIRHADAAGRRGVGAGGAAADWRRVAVDSALGRVGVARGLRLDLGATAKAWTADEAARRVAARYRRPVLVEIGGDVAVAGPTDAPWLVQVAEVADGDGEVVGVIHGGLATSSTVARRWRRPLGDAHHVIDPQHRRTRDRTRSGPPPCGGAPASRPTPSARRRWSGAVRPARLELLGVAARLVDQREWSTTSGPGRRGACGVTLWFLARAAGFMALLGATATVCLGATASGSTPATRARGAETGCCCSWPTAPPPWSPWRSSRSTPCCWSWTATSPSPSPGALVPFTAGYRGVARRAGHARGVLLRVVAPDRRPPRAGSPARRAPRLVAPSAPARLRRVATVAGARTPGRHRHHHLVGVVLYAGSALAVVVAVWARLAAEEQHAAGALASVGMPIGTPALTRQRRDPQTTAFGSPAAPTAYGTARLLAGVTDGAGRPRGAPARARRSAAPHPAGACREGGRGATARPWRSLVPRGAQAGRDAGRLLGGGRAQRLGERTRQPQGPDPHGARPAPGPRRRARRRPGAADPPRLRRGARSGRLRLVGAGARRAAPIGAAPRARHRAGALASIRRRRDPGRAQRARGRARRAARPADPAHPEGSARSTYVRQQRRDLRPDRAPGRHRLPPLRRGR